MSPVDCNTDLSGKGRELKLAPFFIYWWLGCPG
jgi:hypothetical protein